VQTNLFESWQTPIFYLGKSDPKKLDYKWNATLLDYHNTLEKKLSSCHFGKYQRTPCRKELMKLLKN
jgi:hypothetical protein